MKSKVSNLFRDIDKRSEKEKIRLVWFLTAFFMVGVLGVFMTNSAANLSRIGGNGLDLSGLPAFPEVEVGGMTQRIEEGKDLFQDYADLSNAEWETVGNDYIARNEVLPEDGFSTLKLADVDTESGTVILIYEHYYKGVPVLGSKFILTVRTNDEMVVGKRDELHRDIDVIMDPTVTAKDAADVAKKKMEGSGYVFKESKLAIAAYEEEYYLVWDNVFASEQDAAGAEVLVGAMHGNILEGDQSSDNQARNITQ